MRQKHNMPKALKTSKAASSSAKEVYRVILVIIDFPKHATKALFYACKYAVQHKCKIALLHVRPRLDLNPLMFMRRANEKYSRTFAEEYLNEVSRQVVEWGCQLPALYMREGDTIQEVKKLLTEPNHYVSMVVMSDQQFIARASLLANASSDKNKAGFRPFVVIPDRLSYDEVRLII